MADGSLIFDTKIDTSGIDKGVEEIKKKEINVEVPITGKMDAAETQKSVNKAVKGSDAPTVDIQADVSAVEEAVKGLDDALPSPEVEVKVSDAELDAMIAEIMDHLNGMIIDPTMETTGLQAQIDALFDDVELDPSDLLRKLEALKDSVLIRMPVEVDREQFDYFRVDIDEWMAEGAKKKQIEADAEKAKKEVEKVKKEASSKETLKVSADTTDAEKNMDKLKKKTKSLGDIMKISLGTMIGQIGTKALRALGDEIEDAIGRNKKVSDSFARVEASVDNLFDKMVGALAPAISFVADGLSGIINASADAVTGVAALFNPQKDELTERLDSSRKSLEDYRTSAAQSKSTLNATIQEAKNSQAQAEALLNKYDKLVGQEHLSEADLAQAQMIASQVAAIYPTLAAQINENTGLFDVNTTAIRNNIAALTEQASASAYLSVMQGIMEERLKLVDDQMKAQDAADDVWVEWQASLAKDAALKNLETQLKNDASAVNSLAAEIVAAVPETKVFFDRTEDGGYVLKESAGTTESLTGIQNALTAAMTENAAVTDDLNTKTNNANDVVKGLGEAITDVDARLDQCTAAYQKQTAELAKQTQATDELTRKQAELSLENLRAQQAGMAFGAEMERNADKSKQVTASLIDQEAATKALEETQKKNAETNRELESQLNQITAAYDRSRAAAEQQINTVAHGFDKIQPARKTSAKKMKQGLESQTKFLTEYSEKMKQLEELGYNDNVTDMLTDATPENASFVDALIKDAEKGQGAVDDMNATADEAKAAKDKAIEDAQARIEEADQALATEVTKMNDMVANLDQSQLADENIRKTLKAYDDVLVEYAPILQASADKVDGIITNIGSGGSSSKEGTTISPTSVSGNGEATGTEGGGIASLDAVIAQMEQYVTRMYAIGLKLEGKVGEGFKAGTSLETEIATAIGDAETSGNQYFEDNPNSFNSVGKNIVSGIAKGVTDGTGVLEAAVRAAILKGLAAAQSEAQIKSPSRLFAREVGAYIPKGISKGAIDEMPRMVRDISASFSHNYGLIGDGLRNGAGTVINNNTTTSNPQVTVNANVRDQTDVQSLALEIGYIMRRQEAGKGNG